MTSTPTNTTLAGRARRAPAKAGGGLKYLVTAATVAAVIGGWGLIAEPTAGPVEQAGAGLSAAVVPAAGASAVTTGPTLAVAPASGPQPAAPAPAPMITSLRSVTAPMNQPVVRTRSSR